MCSIFFVLIIGYLTVLLRFAISQFRPSLTTGVSVTKSKFGIHRNSCNAFNSNNTNYNLLMSFLGGLSIFFVSFKILPLAFHNGTLFIGISALILGSLFISVADTKFQLLDYIENSKLNDNKNYYQPRQPYRFFATILDEIHYTCIKSSIFENNNFKFSNFLRYISHGFLFHTQLALIGSLLANNFNLGIYMAIISVFILHKPVPSSLLGFIISPVPTAIITVFYYIASYISNLFSALCISFSAGVLIYILCGEILPESKPIHKCSASILCASFGFLVGVILNLVFK